MTTLSIPEWVGLVFLVVTPMLTVLAWVIRQMIRGPLSVIEIKVDILTGRVDAHIQEHAGRDSQIERIDHRVDLLLVNQAPIAVAVGAHQTTDL